MHLTLPGGSSQPSRTRSRCKRNGGEKKRDEAPFQNIQGLKRWLAQQKRRQLPGPPSCTQRPRTSSRRSPGAPGCRSVCRSLPSPDRTRKGLPALRDPAAGRQLPGRHLAGQRMSARRVQPGVHGPARLLLPGRAGSPGARRSLLGLVVHAWLWAAAGSSAQVLNLSLSVDEGLPPGTLVGDIRAGLQAQQRDVGGFFLSEDSDDFHVHPDTGVIRTARRLDRERRDRYSFVAATLRGAVVQVEIRVNDVNDHSPRFPRDELQLDVSELSPPGTAFRLPGAQDPDAGPFGTQGYRLVPPPDPRADPAGPFFQLRYGTPGPPPSALEPLDLVLLRPLDREAAAAHELQIEAWDGGSPRRSGRLRVRLRVLDENDNPPVFEQAEYRAAVREDAPPGAEVCRVRATDRDLGPNGRVRYGLRARPGAGADGAAPFEVEELSGAVRVRAPLDREEQAWHQLLVEARDGGAEPEVATVRVSVAVLDVNDNRPAVHLLFLTEGGAARVSEGARPGDYVARVSVSDADGDPEREEEPTGMLGVGLGGGRISLALEGGEDAFALRPGGPPGVFFLCVEGPLDRESRELYELRLVATDAGFPPLSTQETLLLRLSDVNDQPPVFSQQHYRASVSEATAPGTTVTWVSASDSDEAGTDHARLRYELIQLSALCNPEALRPGTECEPAFTIDPQSGAISTVRTLDREVQETLELRVVAQDLGEPPLSATCLVSVTVDDVNDNEPVFHRQVYGVTLAEHTPVGHCFLQVKASDADAGPFGFVEYSLYDGFQSDEAPPAFQINPRDGQICVSQDLDRERDPASFDLLVTAKDGGGLSAQAFVRVDLEDVNDNHPVFNPSTYVRSISGQTQPGAEIIKVLATDRDAGMYGTVAYELSPGHLTPAFSIDSATGIIYLTSTLAHLEPTTLFLTVCARDGGGLAAVTNAEVTVHVLRTALAPAEFERPTYSFSVSEDAPEDTPVGAVKARASSNSSQPVLYTISSGDPDGRFAVHPRLGTIRTRKALDHEAQPTVVLTIQAQLGGSAAACSSAEVHIAVTDVNDNAPEFLRAAREVRVSPATPPGAALYVARAVDRDSGRNGRVRFSLAGPRPRAFAVHAGLGVLYLRARLGRLEPRRLPLTLAAEDGGEPPRASVLALSVVVEPDAGPSLTFEHLAYRVEVSESAPPGTRLVRLRASAPGPAAAQVRYALEPGADAALFRVQPDTGWVHLRRALDFESVRAHSFRACARLRRRGLLQSASASVTVLVLDENDNAPTFPRGPVFLKVRESPVPLGVIGRVAATDADSGRNGQLSYFLLSDGAFFKMNPSTGELVSWLALDREHQMHHQMTVLVTDHGSPPRNATMAVYVTVTDTNDNSPFFPQCLPGKEFYIKVLEDQPVNTLVTTVFAKDLDEGDNAEITYSMASEDYSDHFKIDANSAEIRTSTILSYDYRPSYRLTVIASDQGQPPLQGRAVLHVQVIPLSKGQVFISQNIRHLVIPENLKPAKITSLMKSPEHLQQYHSGKLHFSLATEDKNGHFEIDSSTGDLFLSKELDYETTPRYVFRVITKDHSQSPALNSTVFLSVDVEDRNDHSPAFQDRVIAISIEENVPIGTLVHTFHAKDGDGSFLNSRVQYFIESLHPGSNPFLIHPSFGTLVTAAPLDRESVPAVTLMVTASDQAVNVTDRRSRSLIAKVVILDVNDHSPAFVSLPIACVREDAAVGSSVHRVHARDPDEGQNGKVTYSIRSGNADTAFVLDESSGLLTIARPLDYEVKTQHVLTLVALDDGVSARSSSQIVTVTVLDVNDEAPVCEQHLYEASVKENQSPGEFVARVEAMDRDSGISSKLQFEILSGASFGFFKINADTGEVVTATTLDREVQDVFTLQVLVRDGGVPSLSCTTTILCTVEDENDHAPEFLGTNQYIEVLENQEPKVVYTVLASDRDAGNNGAVRYHIIDGNTDESFVIDETSGELATTRALDREQVSSFRLTVRCSDLGDPPRSTAVQLPVRVLDDNDHSPAFSTLRYQPSVREDAAVGTVVLVLSAVDKDEGLNGQTEYFLVDESSGAFTINPATGVLRTSRALDREARALYTFQAVARDCSTAGSRSSIVTVTVLVTDVNDNDPAWEQNPIHVFLSSQLPANHTVAILRASDPDAGPSGMVTFSFTDAQSVFSIDEDTGEIKLLQNPTSEYFPAWLWLRVTDQGVPARTTPGLLIVHAEGEDVKISFSQHLYEGLVTENCEAGTSIVTVKAFAPDAVWDIIKYSVLSGNKDEVFSLDSNSGQLTVKEPKFLDFEVRNEVQLIILAESSEHRAYSKVAVSIEDVNDNVPCFEQSVYQASVSEGQGSSAHVIQVTASDLDSGLNGVIEYSIVSGNQGEAFRISALSGEVTTNVLLDRETTCSYSLIVQATDKGRPRLSATAMVRIQVTDINDNAPVFLPSEAVKIAENSLPGVIVSRVSVHDVDSNPAFIFSFAKDGNPGAKFAIDQHTGIVVLAKTLDFEEVTKYELLVQVSDSVHHTEGPLVIQVSDVNDNPPVFSEDFYQVTVPESVPLGSLVLTVSATDLESNENISYRILSSSEEFSIDPVNGTIFTRSPITLLNKIPTIRFLVEASDGGIPELRALTLVEIQVQDENNCAPEFTAGYYNLTLSEDALVESTLVTFSTFDCDWTPENTYVEYSIISGNSQNNFHVDTTSVCSEFPHEQVGYLVLLHSVDREASASHQLVVLASDHGCPPLSSTAIVSIQVLDVDDNPPRFSNLQYHAHARESAPPGSHIAVVSASDPDVGSHAEIFYRVISGDEKEHFHLEERTGVLHVVKPLDYEEMTEFALTIQASDRDKKHCSFSVVFVKLLDDNDHEPQFMSSSLTCAAPENLPVFSSLCSVSAVDFDAGPYGELTYSLLSPCTVAHGRASPRDPFSIDPLTGDLHASQSLDYESADKYCLLVQAEDKGGSTASLTVWVDVEGIDEFEPVFTQDQYFFTLPQKIQERHLVGSVEATDADSGADGVIFYSLATPSPFFSVNRTSGNIYWLKTTPPFMKSQVSEDNTFEIQIIAQSPRAGSRSTSCTVFVNMSLSSDGKRVLPSATSFSVSLTVSFVAFLLLVYVLTVLIVKHTPKATPHHYGKKKASPSLDASVRLTGDAGSCQAPQDQGEGRKEVTPEWLSLISIMEKDLGSPHWRSSSSSHCSVEGETAEDREIQRITKHPSRKDSDSALSNRGSRVRDSGIPRDSDQLSCLSGETEVMASAQVAEGSHAAEGGDGGEGCNPGCVHSHTQPQALQKKEAKEGVLADPERESVCVSGDQEASCATFSTEFTSDHKARGSYAWDCLLSWEPKFQPLALVFNDIAKLKDEHSPKPGIPKERKSLVFPPPLITAVAQPGIKAVPPRMPATAPGQLLQKYSRSPLPPRFSGRSHDPQLFPIPFPADCADSGRVITLRDTQK